MKSYAPPIPRALLGLVSAALSVLTLGAGALLPAATGPSARMQATAATAIESPVGAPAALRYLEPVEVVAIRTPKVISAQERDVLTKRDVQG